MLPSIFNDIIGPVMRGPSSSHTAATWRIARVCLDILSEPPNKAVIEFDKNGVWAANYQTGRTGNYRYRCKAEKENGKSGIAGVMLEEQAGPNRQVQNRMQFNIPGNEIEKI